jgi:hypothetical protein
MVGLITVAVVALIVLVLFSDFPLHSANHAENKASMQKAPEANFKAQAAGREEK